VNDILPDMSADDHDDPVDGVAAIFAPGVLRLRQCDLDHARLSAESSVHGLELCGSTRPSVVDGPENHRKEAK
jgi:hypothetical protein